MPLDAHWSALHLLGECHTRSWRTELPARRQNTTRDWGARFSTSCIPLPTIDDGCRKNPQLSFQETWLALWWQRRMRHTLWVPCVGMYRRQQTHPSLYKHATTISGTSRSTSISSLSYSTNILYVRFWCPTPTTQLEWSPQSTIHWLKWVT